MPPADVVDEARSSTDDQRLRVPLISSRSRLRG